jgi:hypothetical protein
MVLLMGGVLGWGKPASNRNWRGQRAAGGEYVGAAILGELLNDLSERNGEPFLPRAYGGPAWPEGARGSG